ncbi:lantibiotic dehydratase [Actinoplanes sp. NPDC051859]|uniref:lantibiotic dehydratase n=1 Tax=Actinoplanes sp. NPDC051859 TaxID=3363909 RepID=UPI00378918ED
MYRSLDDALLLRAAVCHPAQFDGWPDLTSADAATSWRGWLKRMLTVPEFAQALTLASPALMCRVRATLTGEQEGRDDRRVVLSVLRYLLRATGRATPHGLFAGIAPATVGGSGMVRIGAAHRPVARIRTPWLTAVVDRLEADPQIRAHLTVRANDLLRVRGGEIVLAHRASTLADGAPVHVRIRATDAVRTALATAATPVSWARLTAKVADACGAGTDAADRLLTRLLEQRLLLSALRTPATATDPLGALLAVLAHLPTNGPEEAVPASENPLINALRQVAAVKRRHDRAATAADAASERGQLAALAATISPEPPLGVDLLLDADLVVPATVTAEASRAAAALTRLSAARTGWAGWHRRFLERFGPHALVPVLDAVDPELGLGYPTGYAGSPPAADPPVTGRDRALLALAQRAALTGQREIVLDDGMLTALTGEPPTAVAATTELTVRVHASTMTDIEDGRFTLSLVRVSRNAGTSTGRLLDLLEPTARLRMADAYTHGTPLTADRALLCQLSAPTRYAISMDVARAPKTLPYVLALGEYGGDNGEGQIAVDDIAVTADPDRLYLISLSTRRPVQPVPLTAVDPDQQMLPLARFLAEANTAHAAPCLPFDWGPAAHDLPFLPAVRYGRTVLAEARWRLTPGDLVADSGDVHAWQDQLACWRKTTGCPAAVSVGSGDQRLNLDLDEPSHQALLKDYLRRYGPAVLRTAPPPAGWINDRAHEIVIPLAATAVPVPAPRLPAQVVDVRVHGVLPGTGHSLIKVYTAYERQDRILTHHLPDLLDEIPEATWWFQRYHDPDPHLRLRIAGADTFDIGRWAQQLRADGLASRVVLDTDFGEISRFGGPHAYPAAEALFVADSAAVLAQTVAASGRGAVPRQAWTAASLLDLATAFLGDPDTARRWLLQHVRLGQAPPARAVYDQAVRLADPDRTLMAAVADGPAVLASWQHRATALAAYRAALSAAGVDPAALLPDLLHLHHTRVAGPDRDAEHVCLHLARAAAQSWHARTGSRP